MKPIHFAIYESSFLPRTGIPVTEMYNSILAIHADEPEVVSLFNDLKKDWNEFDAQYGWRMVKPFAERAKQDTHFVFATEYAKIGAATGEVDRTWSDMALGFLLEKKLGKKEPSSGDIALGQYILRWFESGSIAEVEMRAWSPAANWQEGIAVHTEDLPTFPENWWAEFGIAFSPRPLPSEAVLKENLTRAGMLDQLPVFEKEWGRYVAAYESLG